MFQMYILYSYTTTPDKLDVSPLAAILLLWYHIVTITHCFHSFAHLALSPLFMQDLARKGFHEWPSEQSSQPLGAFLAYQKQVGSHGSHSQPGLPEVVLAVPNEGYF